MKYDTRQQVCIEHRLSVSMPIGLLALILAAALLLAVIGLCPAPANAESSAQLAWLDRLQNQEGMYEAAPSYDGSLWKTYHNATDAEYYEMFMRKSEDANWDLFARAGTCQPMDDTTVGVGFCRYLSYEPFMEHMACATTLYTN